MRPVTVRASTHCQKLAIPSELQAQIQDSVAGLSYLEVIALRNREQPCAGCHAQIDPIGVAFAQFDAIGHHDPGIDIRAFGLTPSCAGVASPEFGSLEELAAKLAAEPAVGECIPYMLAGHVGGFRTGRAVDASGRPTGALHASILNYFGIDTAEHADPPAGPIAGL